MALRFTWDLRKAAENLSKHGVSFAEAMTSFEDPMSLSILDQDHSFHEARAILLGRSNRDRLLCVAHVERGDVIRLISARPATVRERRSYEEGT